MDDSLVVSFSLSDIRFEGHIVIRQLWGAALFKPLALQAPLSG